MKVDILSIPIFAGNIELAVSYILKDFSDNAPLKNRCISATGAHGLVEASESLEFKHILHAFFWNLPDGMPTVWVGRLKGNKQMQRCYGPDFFKAMLVASANKNIKHFFCGGKEGVAEKLRSHSQQEFKNEQVVGVFSPPFREMTDDEFQTLNEKIVASGANIVWIGLSTPKQEKFAIRLASFTQVSYIITVGAAFDFHTGLLKQAPKWMQKLGLEWFFRLLMEPQRLFKRYFKIVPQFIWLNIKEFTEIYAFKKNRI